MELPMIRRFGIRRMWRYLKVVKNLGKPNAAIVPSELIPDGIRMMSRGVVNFVTFHLLHRWVLPWWVVRQLDPDDPSYLPRGMNLAWTNAGHRNWTAVGPLGGQHEAIVDPRGAVMVWHDGPSYEFWASADGHTWTFPSIASAVIQAVDPSSGSVITKFSASALEIETSVWGAWHGDQEIIRLDARALNRGPLPCKAALAFALRPFNVEGIAPVHSLSIDGGQVVVDGSSACSAQSTPSRFVLSRYADGDVASQLSCPSHEAMVQCPAGLAAGALIYERELPPGEDYTVRVALTSAPRAATVPPPAATDSFGPDAEIRETWRSNLACGTQFQLPPQTLRDCTKANLSYLLLFDDGDTICPGPYTYHTYWFRDSAYLINALDAWGFHERAKQKLLNYPQRQQRDGFFRSQNGEWDSNGQAIWTIVQHCRWTGDKALLRQQYPAIKKGADWIIGKRMMTRTGEQPHWGLLPAGFSAEHLGPSDHYFWDNFWGLAGLRDAAQAASWLNYPSDAASLRYAYDSYRRDIDRVIHYEAQRLKMDVIPAAPGRHWDGGAIGGVAAHYPTGLYAADDHLLMGTVEHLLSDFSWKGLYRHEIVHSGVNIYLSCQLAQCLLGRRDPRVWAMVDAMLAAATPTWTWPEAIHPRTGGGAMGDGHHGWAIADWLLLIRTLLVTEEGNGLVLLPVPRANWPDEQAAIGIEQGATFFGPVSFAAQWDKGALELEWSSQWRSDPGYIEIALPGIFLQATGKICQGSLPNRALLDGPTGQARIKWAYLPTGEGQ